ncbi:MAG: transposase [Chloroflexi bacterium]|nr:transposase [Chloroflexota bacterium]
MKSPTHNRRSPRLKGYDYSLPGAYFITICVKDRNCRLSTLVGEEVQLTKEGTIVKKVWEDLPEHFENIKLDRFVVMPNHVHGIVWILEDNEPHVGARHASPLPRSGPKPGSLGTIIGSFKSAATKQINQFRNTTGSPFWQRNYYEHILRDDRDLFKHRKYIQENPIKWALDEYHQDQP